MRIAVCLKQVPDPLMIRYDHLSDKVKHIIWTLDSASLSALEEALKVKNKFQAEMVAVSAGPDRVERELKKALLYGADRAIRVWQNWMEKADTFAVSVALAEVLGELNPNIVLCGARSDDTSSEFMGACLAEKLDMALVTRVKEIEKIDGNTVIVHRKLEKGEVEAYAAELPVVITIEPSDPKYPLPHGERLRVGLKKSVEVFKKQFNPPNLLLNVLIPATKPKPRPKVFSTARMSPEEMMRLMRGETKKKIVLSGNLDNETKKIVEKLKEWGVL